MNKRSHAENNLFDIVRLYYPNEWRKNVICEGLLQKDKVKPFEWFLCSHRIYDTKNDLYYADISTTVQFFCPNSGKTLLANGLSKRGQKYADPEIIRSRLLILSDPHNKKVLCKKYNYMCGCDSNKSILSTDCDLIKDKNYLLDGSKMSIKLGYDGVIIQHDPSENMDNCLEFLLCSGATFVFKKGILKEVGVKFPDRCNIIKYAKRHNSYLRSISNGNFLTCQEIDNLIKENDCSSVSGILYEMLEKIK